MSIQGTDFYAAAQERRTEAAQRAAEVRKKLLKSTLDLDGSESVDETLLIGHWLDSRDRQPQTDDEYNSSATGKDPDFG